jgi:hypothetical protein
MIVSAWNPSASDNTKSFEENVANNKAAAALPLSFNFM